MCELARQLWMRRVRAPRLRLLALAAALAVLAASCATSPPPSATQRQRWATAWIGALNSHRLQQVAPLLESKGTYEDPLTGGPRSGPTLAYFLVMTWNHFPNLQYELRRVTGSDRVLTLEWRASGLRAPVDGVFIVELGDDVIARVRGYFDAAKFEPPAAAATPRKS